MENENAKKTKAFTVVKKESGEVVAIIDLEAGNIVEMDGYEVLTDDEVVGYVENQG